MNRRGRALLSFLLFTIFSLLIYFLNPVGNNIDNATCPAMTSPYIPPCLEDCDQVEAGTGTCGVNACEEVVRHWSYAFLLALFAGSVGGSDFYLGYSERGYKKLRIGVFSILGLDLLLVALIIAAKLIPASLRSSRWIKTLYTLFSYLVSIMVGGLIGFLIILVGAAIMDIYTLYFYDKLDVNQCPLV